MDKSYDPNFRYASNEAAPPPSDWAMGDDGGGVAMGPTLPPPTTTTKKPIKKSGSRQPFDSTLGTDDGGYAQSSSGGRGIMNSNGQCECKSFDKEYYRIT